MSRVGRKPFELKHVEKLGASPLARERLAWILKSLSGRCTVPEACVALGINASRFHKLRSDWLQAAAASLEPGRPGRRPLAASPESERIAELEDQVQRLEVQARASQVRAELAQALPQVVGGASGPGKKAKSASAGKRSEKKSRSRRRSRARRGTGK